MRRAAARRIFLVAALLLAVGNALGAGEGPPPAVEPRTLASQVQEIFAVKCVECHDAATARPKGDFGYVLDLERVAANRDWVMPGKAEKSELYLLVKSEEMPGNEASVPPLTAEEKDLVKRWIDNGAGMTKANATLPTPTAEARLKASPAAPAPAKRSLPFLWRLIRALGQFHPPSAHFPIALLIAACPAEFMWLRTRKGSWKSVVRFCVMLGAGSAAVTAGLGWCDAVFSNYVGASASVLAWHRWVGTATAAWAAGTAAVSEVSHRRGQPPGWRRAFRAILFVGIALVSVSGYLGAALIYGIRHFSW